MHEITSTSYCSSTYHISLRIVLWDKFVWFGHNIPRMAFILWLAITDWFTTKDRIRKYAPCTEARCVFWLGTVETIEHICLLSASLVLEFGLVLWVSVVLVGKDFLWQELDVANMSRQQLLEDTNRTSRA